MREKRSKFQKIAMIIGAISLIASIIELPRNTAVVLSGIDSALVFANSLAGRLLLALVGLLLIAIIAAPPSVWRRSWFLSRCGQRVKSVGLWAGFRSEGWNVTPKTAHDKPIEVAPVEGTPSSGCVVKCDFSYDFVAEYSPTNVAPDASLLLLTGQFPQPSQRLDIGLFGSPRFGIATSLVFSSGNARQLELKLMPSLESANPQLLYGDIWQMKVKPLRRADGYEEWLLDLDSIRRHLLGPNPTGSLVTIRFDGNYMVLRSVEFFRTSGILRRLWFAIDLLIQRGELAA